MSEILTIIKKELRRFFTDRRMVVSLLLPGILMFVMYTFIGKIDAVATKSYKGYFINESVIAAEAFGSVKNLEIIATNKSADEIKQQIKDGKTDVLVIFEQGFDEKVAGGLLPQVEIWYNSSDEASSSAYAELVAALYPYSVQVNPIFGINTAEKGYDLANDTDSTAQLLATILPYIIIVLLYSGCMAIVTESIAGEKERGTIATLLVTPVKRSHIAIGKICALSVTALVSALASFIGLIAGMPSLTSATGDELNLSIYGAATYLQLFVVLVLAVLLFTVILSVFSAMAKSVKEATSYAGPLMIVIVMVGIVAVLFGGSLTSNFALYFIPIGNLVFSLMAIFSMRITAAQFAVTAISNVVFIALGMFALAKMFNSEKFMFNAK